MNIPLEVKAELLLRERFGFPSFRAGQREVLHAVLKKEDTLAVMPTGGGKSLGYVLPALLLPRPVLVVSPLIALMKDQADQLRARRIPVGVINSSIPFEEQREVMRGYQDGRLRLMFVAPERFRSERFIEALSGFPPSVFAVDEAHCISEWGHDFRPDYRRLKEAVDQLGHPPILALTATATEGVRNDIARSLGMIRPTIIVKGFERPNLDFVVHRTTGKENKLQAAIDEAKRGGTGIVYASTRKNVEEATLRLRQAGVRAGFYHAGLKDSDRRMVQEHFSNGSLPVVVATNAFGMGIDRADLRFVIHVDLPGSVEAYTQEAGRAGRDGAPARCVLFFAPSDVRLQRFFIESSWPESAVIMDTLRSVQRFGEGALIEERTLIPEPGGPIHPRAVDSALRILEEASAIQRTMDKSGRFVRVLGEAHVDLGRVRARAEREFERLMKMVDYAERAGCHRAWLVNYFAGPGSASDCGTCEGCRVQSTRRELKDEEMEELRTALSAVRAVSGRYGKKKVGSMLAGSKARDLQESRLDKNPHYGRLKHRKGTFVDQLLSECIALGLCALDGGEYPVLSLTVAGHEVIQGRRRVHLLCFDKRSAPKQGTRSAGGPLTDADSEVFESLRRWRVDQAETEGVPAYRILHNAAIEAISRDMPADETGLLSVKGMGPAKVDRYGAAILEVIRATRTSPGG